MKNANTTFELKYNHGLIKVERRTLDGQSIFRIHFDDKRKPLVITRASNANAARFWTSIPEGRQKEAEEIGSLILEAAGRA